MMQNHRCPVCERSDALSAYCEASGFQVYVCQICNSDHVHPVPTPQQLKAYYDRSAWFEGGEHGGYANYDVQTEHSVRHIQSILEAFETGIGRSVLDVGCGYGTHLALAASRGWKCFGVEVSDHARGVAKSRLASDVHIVPDVDEMVPHKFDLILMLDVLEHLPAPATLFYKLFALGAIQPHTQVVITTPNADSTAATQDPGQWKYRHPPSHLVLYSAQALTVLLERMRFTDIRVEGIHPVSARAEAQAPWRDFEGLQAVASGSDFAAFMQERYVPGTWSRLAEYEHVPRYAIAKSLASGKAVLDFGCGTGYGSALLASVADSVTGLDVDAGAIEWANQTHMRPGLQFLRRDDLGASLHQANFDLVTCFEMIEHVDFATQTAVIASIDRLLKDDGLLLISTPNPEVTQHYGTNPFHVREMTRNEFSALLSPHFPYVTMLEQRISNAISITRVGGSGSLLSLPLQEEGLGNKPAAFVALCSRRPIDLPSEIVFFDEQSDLILDYLAREKALNTARFEAYRMAEQVQNERSRTADGLARLKALEQDVGGNRVLFEASLACCSSEIATLRAVLGERDAALAAKDGELQASQALIREGDAALVANGKALAELANDRYRLATALEEQVAQCRQIEADLEDARQSTTSARAAILQAHTDMVLLRRTKWFRLRHAMITKPRTWRTYVRIAYLIFALVTPAIVKLRVGPFFYKLKQRFLAFGRAGLPGGQPSNAYEVCQPRSLAARRPLIVHVIANFMTGGSSRLVIDLMEHLGGQFEQSVVTSFIPDPPVYTGIQITEYRHPEDETVFVEHFQRLRPAFIHMHYWGDCDEPWYAKAMIAAERLGVPVIENVNTPVTPYLSPVIEHYVYVSDYVRRTFGQGEANHLTIYPGSDFSHFDASVLDPCPDHCVGMVYRLESDKLNELAIEPFIRIVQKRPRTMVLIVGGGSLLVPFQDAVARAGLTMNFEFTGYVAYEALPALYRRMSVFVAPVWKESFGQVSAFAMNMRVPVIGYDIGAIREIVGDLALVAEPADADHLSDIAVRLLDSPALRQQISDAQQARAKAHFSLPAMIAAYSSLYQDMKHSPTEAVA